MVVTIKKSFTPFLVALVGAVLPFVTMQAQGQAAKPLHLQDALTAALNHNATLKVSALDTRISKSNYRQTNAVFLPHVEASYTAMTTNNPLNVFGTKLQQERVTAADFNPDLLNNPGHAEDYSAKIELQQPLLNLDMLYQRAAAKKQNEINQYKQQRTQEYVMFDVQKAYLDLQLAYKSVAVLEESMSNVRQIETITRNFFTQGLIKKSDLLNVQVSVATVESNLTKARSMVSSASEALALAMGEPPIALYVPDTLSIDDTVNGAFATQVSPSRSDLMAMQKALEATSLMVKSEKMNLLPRVNAFASYQYNDAKINHFDANSYLAGVKLSWTLFNGTQTYHAISARKDEREKLEVQLKQQQDQSQLELNKANRDRMDFLSEIKRQNVSVEQAQESMRIMKDRYKEGLVSTSDMLMTHTQLLQQKLLQAQAVYGKNLTEAYLSFLGAK